MNMMASFAQPHREPPADLDAEQALLSELIANPELFDAVEGTISPSDFADPAHALIYRHAAEMDRDGGIILSRLARALEPMPELADVGGKQYIAELAMNALKVYTPVSIGKQARYIAELSKRRQLIALSQSFADQAYTTDQSVAAQIAELEREIEAIGGQATTAAPSFADGITEALSDFERAYTAGGGIQGLPSGFGDLDELLGGFERGNVYVLAARPGMGKTALANNIAFHVAAHSGSVAIFNLEMPQKQIAGRLICAAAGVSLHNARRGILQPHDFERLDQARRNITNLPIAIDDTPGISPSYIRSRCAELSAKSPLDLVVIDYLQLMETDTDRRNSNRNTEVTEISKMVKTIAKACDVPVLVLSQLNRGVESRDDKRPNLADLRESGAIEQDADVVMFLYREEYYLRKAEPDPSELDKVEAWTMKMEGAKGKAELDVAKNRHGPDGRVLMRFNGPLMQFASAPHGEI